MQNWKSKIYLGDIFEKFKDDGKPSEEISNVGKEIAQRISKNMFANEPEMKDIIFRLSDVDVIDEIDEILADLYHFGDCNKRIWIQTLS